MLAGLFYVLLCWVENFVSLPWSLLFAPGTRCFSNLITGVSHCRTLFLWTGFLLSFDLIAGLDTWGVGCFSVIALYALQFFRLCRRGLSYSPSICSERYCVMLPTPVFVSPWFYNRLLCLLCYYENTPAHAFFVSNSIAGLVAWGGGCCYVGL